MFSAARTFFRRSRGCRVSFSCFAFPDTFSAIPRASGPVLMFCAPGLIFDGTEGVGSRVHILRSRTRFSWFRGRRVSISYFALPDSFKAARRASGLDFLFCATGLIFGGTESVGSHFHVLRARNHFRRYRWRRVPFSSFALPDSYSAVPRRRVPFSCFAFPDSFLTVRRAYGPVFLFCAS
jgi:hypothetical protein